jgi:hypothetical protein
VSESLQLQQLCERGQELLIATDYIGAERALVEAEAIAIRIEDFDTLSRLYMPLQEARRQRRQRCGEGIVELDLIGDLDPRQIIEKYPHGQLLVAGWGTIEPALIVRDLRQERGLYVETFLASASRGSRGLCLEVFALPGEPASFSIDEQDLPRGEKPGDAQTFAIVMKMWERLHAPFLALADATVDPMQRIEAYRKTIRVDYACELAHQKLAHTAREMSRHAAS